jgi:isochorismate synthase
MPPTASTMTARPMFIPQLGRIDRDSLLATCRRAGEQARRRRQPVLASWAKPLYLADPVEIWSRARHTVERSLLWQSAWDQGSIVAFGTAHDLRGSGDDRVGSVRDDWAALSRDVVGGATADTVLLAGGGPLAIGGFAFSAEESAGERRLPDALLWVPSMQIRSTVPDPGARQFPVPAELCLNAMLTPDSDPEHVAGELAHLADVCLPRDSAELLRIDERQLPRSPGARTHTSVEVPPADDWKDLVRRATAGIGKGDFEKVVLARELRVIASAPFDVPAAVRRLRDASPGTTLFAVDHGDRTFLGSTPEYLVRVSGRTVHVLGLAGTMPRGVTPDQDDALERELVESAKIQHEHDVVVRMLADALRDSCAKVTIETPPQVLKLANVQHLSTKVRGRLADDSRAHVLDFVERLHPTPALGGHPRKDALSWLSGNEGLDRSWYAGVIGWADCAGQGQFAVAIRSALLQGDSASLYAGCGIVAGSDPEDEYAETCAKLGVMMNALGME